MSSTLLEPKNLPSSISTQLELYRNWLSVLTFFDSIVFCQSLPRVVISTDLLVVPSIGIFVGCFRKKEQPTDQKKPHGVDLSLYINFRVALVIMIQFQPNSSLGWHWFLFRGYFRNTYFWKKILESMSFDHFSNFSERKKEPLFIVHKDEN